LSWLLGFTFEIHDMGYPGEGETWTQHVLEHQFDGDLVASFWVPQAERRDGSIQLRGHLDLSTVLVARHAMVERWDLFSWARPFTWDLWLAFVALVVVSGVVDWLLEREFAPTQKLVSSIREYAAGVLWGGYEYPLTRGSAVYQVLVAFILLIVNASYTANLAAFITISAQATLSATSVDQMFAEQVPLCVMPGGWQMRFDAEHPRMPYVMIEGEGTAAETLSEGVKCDGMVTPRNNYDTWRSDPAYCDFRVAEVIYASNGGWMTNRASECVQYAIEWAMYQLESNGTTDAIYRKYVPVAACASQTELEMATFESTGTEARRSRRRLADGADATDGATGLSTHQRRLKSSRSMTSSGSESSSTLTQMDTRDVAGIFVFWGAVTVALMAYAGGRWIMRRRREIRPDGNPSADMVVDDETSTSVVHTYGLPANINLNNESALLHEVLRQMGGLHDDFERQLGGLHDEIGHIKQAQTAQGKRSASSVAASSVVQLTKAPSMKIRSSIVSAKSKVVPASKAQRVATGTDVQVVEASEVEDEVPTREL